MLPGSKSEADARPADRLAWVDVARGIGILLVVYGHALRAQVTSGNFDPLWLPQVQDTIIYAFHMPLFFFVAGLFIQRGVNRGAKSFFTTKLETLAYPYVLWSLISIGLGALAGGAVNHSMSLNMAGRIWYEPVYQYWFLYVLFVCNVVAFIVRGYRVAVALLILFGIVGAAGYLPLILSLSLDNFPYFFGGALIGPILASRPLSIRIAGMLLMTGAVLAIVRLTVLPVMATGVDARILAVLAATSGIMIVVGISRIIALHASALAFIGAASMAIYVLHTIFSASLRIGLQALGFTNPLLALVACTVIGIAGPLVVREFALRYGLMRVMALGEAGSRVKGKPV